MSTPVIRWPRVNDGDGCVSLGMLTNRRPGADKADELRLTAAFFSPEDDEPFAVIGWGCESCVDGRTERVSHDYYATFEDMRRYSVADAAYEVAKYASEKIGVKTDEKLTPEMVRDVAAREMRAALALNTEAPAWVLAWAGLDEATAAAFRGKPAKPEACAAEKKPRAAKVETEEVAAETSPSPVKCVEPVAKSVELPAKCVELRTTHFRGVPLRTAAEWEDPSAEGVFVGVPNERYHACQSLSGTRAAKFAKSAAHSVLDEEIPARSRDIGTMVHGDILEGKDAAALGFIVVPGKTTTKDGCVTEDMVRVAKACAAAIREDAKSAFVATLPGLRELSCRARCPESGLMLRCRFDLAPEAGGWAWDIKTTSSESPAEFDNAFGEFGYAVSGAHYLRVAALVGLPFRAMRYACVSTKAPHETWVKKFGPIAGCDVVRHKVDEEWIEVNVFELATAAAVNAAKAEAHGRATGQYPKRRHEPDVVALKPWHITALRQAANGDAIPY